MTLYVDTSALMKRYIAEPDSERAEELIRSDPLLVTSRLTDIELRRNLSRLLAKDQLAEARRRAKRDLEAFVVVSLDDVTCREAALIAERTLCRSLDAIHLAAARRVGVSTELLTFDTRQAQAARTIGLTVRTVSENARSLGAQSSEFE